MITGPTVSAPLLHHHGRVALRHARHRDFAGALLANLSQVTLCRYASEEYKDARAPQNLYPIAGLERVLRRRLGDARLLYRALRESAWGHSRS